MRLSPRESLGDLLRDCTDWYIPVYTVYRLVYTGIYSYILCILRYRLAQGLYIVLQTSIYRYIICTDWYIPVYTGIYSDILLCAGFRGAHRDTMMPEPSTAPEPEGWDPEDI